MKTIFTLCTFLVLSMQQTVAQTYTFNWATSFVTNWLAGVLFGNANNINSSTVNASVTISSNQANAFSTYSGFTTASPTVANTPFTTTLWSASPNIAIGCNFSNKNNYADIVITFNAAVTNVKFNVADIDKTALSDSYFDEIVVTGSDAGTPVTNPSISKLNSFLNNSIVISGNTVTANTNWLSGGNSTSSFLEQNGTVVVDFGSTILTSVNIRFRSNLASDNNPGEQEIAIGNISFERAIVLPLTLTSFNGALNNNTVKLYWSTAQEENLGEFIVEKSTNGIDWQTLTTVQAAGNSNGNREYNAVDLNAFSLNYYRLKQVDRSGNYSYSQTIRIRNNANETTKIRAYPNPATNTATITINSENKLDAHIKLYNQFGFQLQHIQRPLIAGSNNIPVPGVQGLPTGTYIITVADATGKKIGTTQLIKQ